MDGAVPLRWWGSPKKYSARLLKRVGRWRIRQKKTDRAPIEKRVKRLNVSKYFVRQREAMEKKISTEEGILLRVNRSIQSEGAFAMIKEDMSFRRFLTRGSPNVTVEWYLVSMAYNLLKLHYKIQTGRLGTHLFVPTAA